MTQGKGAGGFLDEQIGPGRVGGGESPHIDRRGYVGARNSTRCWPNGRASAGDPRSLRSRRRFRPEQNGALGAQIKI